MKRRISYYSALSASALVLLALAAFPADVKRTAADGLYLCAAVIVPALFPFFAASSLVVETGLAAVVGRAARPLMRPLFRVGGAGAAALVLGLVGGYPTGAQTAAELYERGELGKAEAERLLGFCNNCGPAFIMGVAGAAVSGNASAGVMLYVTHIAAALVVGILFRFYKRGEQPIPRTRTAASVEYLNFGSALASSIRSALQSTLNVCAFVVFFAVVTGLLRRFGVTPQGSGGALFAGFIEMSGGIAELAGIAEQRTALRITAFLLGFGGLSVHMQTFTFVASKGLSVRTGVVGKLLHGTIAAALMVITCSF